MSDEVIIRKAEFILSAARSHQWPETDMPEIAFSGRSNVGKSSLINRLLNRKKLVKTSQTPGKTRLINFFNINDQWMFVDLPGYGYAKVSKSERRQWGGMIETFLNESPNLVAVAFLLDYRRVPSEDDLLMAEYLLSSGVHVIPVITKADKLSSNERVKAKKKILEKMGSFIEPSMLVEFSAVTGRGKEALWERIVAVTEE